MDAVLAYDTNRGGARFARTHTARSYDARLLLSTENGETNQLELHGLSATFPLVDRFADGSVVVVGPRSSYRPETKGEANASIYNGRGEKIAEFAMGDGIADVQVDPADRIWVGYFDEGVFGNFGWGEHGEESAPMGSRGLLCFDRNGAKLWEFESPEGIGPIDDCYALNVSKLAAWVYYYSDFPFARIDLTSLEVSAWTTAGPGGGSFATDGERVLLYFGLREGEHRVTLMKFGERTADVEREFSLALPHDDSDVVSVVGRGSALYVFTKAFLHVFSLHEIA